MLFDPLYFHVKRCLLRRVLGNLVEMYPYGTRTSFGTRLTIPFVYVGAYGYYTDSNDRDYVRARELYQKLGRWMHTNPLWHGEMTFAYSGCGPVAFNDASGNTPGRELIVFANGNAQDIAHEVPAFDVKEHKVTTESIDVISYTTTDFECCLG